MQIAWKTLSNFIILFLILQISLPFLYARDEEVSPDIFFSKEGNILIEAHETSLRKILETVFQEYQVEVVGLEDRLEELVSLSFERKNIEEVLRQFLKELGEKNYAFEFSMEKLVRVSVFPDGIDNKASTFQIDARGRAKTKVYVNAVRVRDIVSGTQAELLGIKEGDIILEYDGIRIRDVRQLIREVKKRPSDQKVEMIAIRDHEKMVFTLNGGFIGIRIFTTKILEDDLLKHLPE